MRRAVFYEPRRIPHFESLQTHKTLSAGSPQAFIISFIKIQINFAELVKIRTMLLALWFIGEFIA